MVTINISNEEIERKFDESVLAQEAIENKPVVLSKTAEAAFKRAKDASAVKDAQCAVQVAELARQRETEARMKRIGSVIPDQPRSGEQSNLFDFGGKNVRTNDETA